MTELVVKPIGVSDVVKIHKTVTEFTSYPETHFEERLKGIDNLVIGAYINEDLVGYLIGYDRFCDSSFYCWMTGVNPHFRRQGVLKALMNYQAEWARKRGYTKIKIKTRNKLREMLAYLVMNGFNFTEVVKYPNIEDNRIFLEKNL
ncbi:MAG: GNAT family N-acetyltransferase [Theionarchaea archaeon]|nr:GNAT family N-acetyltransferase [Theionarchaea archaeon]